MPGDDESADDACAVTARLIDAITRGDVEAVAALYAPDATIWHNFDGIDQSVEDNLRVLAWMTKKLPDRRYEDVRRHPIPGGCVQQHVLKGTAPDGTAIEMPACLVVSVEDGRVTRIEEYLDTAQVAPLTR